VGLKRENGKKRASPIMLSRFKLEGDTKKKSKKQGREVLIIMDDVRLESHTSKDGILATAEIVDRSHRRKKELAKVVQVWGPGEKPSR